MILPAKNASSAKLPKPGAKKSKVSLFDKKRLKGWFACYSPRDETKSTGKIELEIEVMTDVEATDKPTAKAREEPNQYPKLDPPNRPETSFFWLSNPWKSFKFIIWKNYKWYIILFIILLLIALAIFIFIYTAPSSIMTAIVGKLVP